ncbi:hypothetical protein ACFT4A_04305 [Streptomyces sp. NPDC057099]|uniref:hypothetical protein n=1 Tax=Streptomyces sp. NPDC057099 TaxID=3346019 RepID=UPI0036299FB6
MAGYGSGVAPWFQQCVVATGRLPLLSFLVGLLTAFVGIRFSVRLIRAEVRWWPGNVRLGGLHVHHVVFGVVLMAAAGIAGLAVPDGWPVWRAVLAVVFGIGTGLVLDEFALILHLEDVYWTERGRTSVDAVFAAVALSGMMLIGMRPLGLCRWDVLSRDGATAVFAAEVAGALLLAAVTLLKGKTWTGLVGIFWPPLLVVGALRLSRPRALWARRWYGVRRPDRQRRAEARESRLRVPLMAAKVRVQELLAGRHDLPDPRPAPTHRQRSPHCPGRAGHARSRSSADHRTRPRNGRWIYEKNRLSAVKSVCAHNGGASPPMN